MSPLRRIMRRFRIDEISGVDKPAQEGADARIFKRYTEPEGEVDMNYSKKAEAIFKRDSEIDALKAKAEEYRKLHPDVSEEQAFAKVYADPANRLSVIRERRAAHEALYA